MTCKSDIVLMSGFPASGKSSINDQYEDDGYLIISRDVLGGTMKDILKVAEYDIRDGVKVVIDATFPTIESRKPFVELAKRYNKTIACHLMDTSKEDALINAILRVKKLTGEFYFHESESPDKYKRDPQVFVFPAIFKHAKLIVKNRTTKAEGFDELEITKFKREWPKYSNKAVLIDLDGTVRETKSGDKFPKTVDDQYILPNTEKVLKEYKNKGYLILGVTNQSGVNKKQLIDNVDDIIKKTNDLMGNIMDDYKYCPHSIPAQICVCRKPQSGMGLYFMDKYKLDLSQCIMVGDSTTDKNFAERLDMKYFEHKEFFNR